MQACSDHTARASAAVPGRLAASRMFTLAFWCCLKKHDSGSAADATGVVIIGRSSSAASSVRVHEGGIMAAAGDEHGDRLTTFSSVMSIHFRLKLKAKTHSYGLSPAPSDKSHPFKVQMWTRNCAI